MKIGNLLFGANIKIPECHEEGTITAVDTFLGAVLGISSANYTPTC